MVLLYPISYEKMVLLSFSSICVRQLLCIYVRGGTQNKHTIHKNKKLMQSHAHHRAKREPTAKHIKEYTTQNKKKLYAYNFQLESYADILI